MYTFYIVNITHKRIHLDPNTYVHKDIVVPSSGYVFKRQQLFGYIIYKTESNKDLY